ncbi:MAG: type III-B CRISPR module-associated protein Cmr5 [Limisphaerales bacterium]|jgi:CRISPR type III-B/RAMP module-associated protein Cmr5
MKTLSQVRATNALKCRGVEYGGQAGGEVISKLPALIQNNGLLATLAFCLDKGGGHLKAAELIVEHLSDERVNIAKSKKVDELIDELASGNAALLRRATAEALALLNYMKRFAGR